MVRKSSKNTKIKPSRDKFVAGLIKKLTPAQAALAAGYSESSAASAGSRLAKDPKILEMLAKIRRKASEQVQIDANWVLSRLGRLADFNMAKFVSVDKLGEAVLDFSAATEEDWFCIQEYSYDEVSKPSGAGKNKGRTNLNKLRLKPVDKIKALETILKWLGAKEISEQSGTDANTSGEQKWIVEVVPSRRETSEQE